MEKYLKRPISFSLTFGLAHLSTFNCERPCIELGKRLARRLERAAGSAPVPSECLVGAAER
jgi:peptidoglycan/LPS O-acetylase OafA/YrhL